jgi:hypothetical protein
MIPTVFKPFMKQLLSATEARTVAWREADGNSYYCQQNGGTIVLSRHFDPDREIAEIRVRFESKGRITPFSVYDSEGSDYMQLDDLYSAIIANANDVHIDLKAFFSGPTD